MILTFVVAETLPNGSAMVEVLGNVFDVDMSDHWSPCEASTSDNTCRQSVFLDLHRDKEAINAMLKHIGGKRGCRCAYLFNRQNAEENHCRLS